MPANSAKICSRPTTRPSVHPSRAIGRSDVRASASSPAVRGPLRRAATPGGRRPGRTARDASERGRGARKLGAGAQQHREHGTWPRARDDEPPGLGVGERTGHGQADPVPVLGARAAREGRAGIVTEARALVGNVSTKPSSDIDMFATTSLMAPAWASAARNGDAAPAGCRRGRGRSPGGTRPNRRCR